jgi:hypothetical protein
MRSARSALAALLAVMASALLVVFAPGSATASPAGSIKVATVTAARAAMGQLGMQDTIVCSIFVDYPHKSTHVPGMVNVEARVVCTAPVSRIEGLVGLFRDGALVKSEPGGSFGSASLRWNAADPCVNGTYGGAALANVYFPAGYVPPTGQIGNRSIDVAITC